MNKNDEIEYEKIIIDIPKNTQAVSVVSISSTGNGLQQIMNTHTYCTEDVKERIVKNAQN